MRALALDARTWSMYAGMLAGGVALVLLLHHYFFVLVEKLSERRELHLYTALLRHVKLLTQVMVLLAVSVTILALAPLSGTAQGVVFHSAELAAIAAIGWLFIALGKFVSRFIEHRYNLEGGETR